MVQRTLATHYVYKFYSPDCGIQPAVTVSTGFCSEHVKSGHCLVLQYRLLQLDLSRSMYSQPGLSASGDSQLRPPPNAPRLRRYSYNAPIHTPLLPCQLVRVPSALSKHNLDSKALRSPACDSHPLKTDSLYMCASQTRLHQRACADVDS